MIQYTGHSSWQQWAAERFLHLDDLPVLHNDRRWPIVIEMTCFTGAFHRPEPTLDEGLLTLDGAGVVAAWGATGLGVSTGHSSLDEGFFQAVFSDTVSTTTVRGAGCLGRQIVPGRYRPESRLAGYLYAFRRPGPQAKPDHPPVGQPDLSAFRISEHT